MKTKEVMKLYEQYVLPTYTRSPLCISKGKGSKVWDLEGKEYLDFFPGWGVSGLGHCHPNVMNAIKHQVRKLLHVSNNYFGLKQAQLAQKIVQSSFSGRVFFCNSGAEAVESAIKFARKFGSKDGRYEIIAMDKSFHGRTLATLTATGQEKVHAGFEPLPAGFKHVPFNDFEALSQAVTGKTVAIVMEPVQGEGGVHVADPDYVNRVRTLCNEKNILLIFDEVQTGVGRTGKWFAFQHYGVEPDLMSLAKALGGGVPIGALVVNQRIGKEVLTPGTHASTYGGNPLVAAAALSVLKTIEEQKVLPNVQKMGNYLRARLVTLKEKYSWIREVRGMGLMLGVELDRSGVEIVDACRVHGLLINCTQGNILRVMPAMTVTKRSVDTAIQILDSVLSQVDRKAPVESVSAS
jgi:acetylornithine/N-succinyldiaminopimelate aminotransferase